MRPTLIRRAYGLGSDGHHGVQQFRQRVPYKNFKSQYGPQDESAKIKAGHYDISYFRRIAPMVTAFGASAGIFALFFFDGIPRVQKDILQKIPVIGDFFVHEVPAEDNPF
ncbi:hypothetical protein LTR95_016710 [Oleoguttula sp. CCFEE 5521]